jgi:hypothetical protein
MNKYERDQFNQKIQLKLAGIIERMLENESKSSSESTQKREKDQAQSRSETGKDVGKRFDNYHYEEVLDVD